MESNTNHPPVFAVSSLLHQPDVLPDELQAPSDPWPNRQEKVSELRSSWKDAQSFSGILRTSGLWLFFGDIASLFSVLIVSHFISILSETDSIRISKQLLFFILMGGASLLWLGAKGHYRHRLPFWQTISHILQIALAGYLACGAEYLLNGPSFPAEWFCLNWTLFVTLILCMRNIVRHGLTANNKWEVPVLLVGNGFCAKAAQETLHRESEIGFRVVKQVSLETLSTHKGLNAWKYFLTLYNASHVLLAPEPAGFDKYNHVLKAMVRERVPFSMIPPWSGLPTRTLSQHPSLIYDAMLFHDTNPLHSTASRFFKRSFDVLVSAVSLLFLFPLFIVIAIKVKQDGGPAFFRQSRIGRDGTMFQCYKFRSMHVDADEIFKTYLTENPETAHEWKEFQKLKHDIRVSKIGHVIRRTSMDELPQLFNVLKGDMSLVGPRPIMQNQREFYGDNFAYYESMRPGMTGPWQVSGRNKLTFSERIQLECNYVRNWSLWMDIVILLKTIPALLEMDNAF